MVKSGRFLAVSVMAVVPAIASAQGVQPQPHAEGRRHAIRMMEAVLSRAVLTGAEHLAEQLGSGNPNVSFFTGQARARGFVLDGYGLFFHVEIPEMQQSLVFSVTTLERDLALAKSLDALRTAVESIPDGPSKAQAELAIKRLQLQVGPVAPAAGTVEGGARGTLRAANTSFADTTGVSPIPSPVMRDPNAAYRDAIKTALIDAMLEHSRGLSIPPDEWLSVAAHRGESPLAPNEIVTTSTLVLRIKGSDLARFDADRSLKDEVRSRVEVREF